MVAASDISQQVTPNGPNPLLLESGDPDLVPTAFLRQGEGGQERTLASADHVIFKHPEKLGVIIEPFIRGEEFRGEFKGLSAG